MYRVQYPFQCGGKCFSIYTTYTYLKTYEMKHKFSCFIFVLIFDILPLNFDLVPFVTQNYNTNSSFLHIHL